MEYLTFIKTHKDFRLRFNLCNNLTEHNEYYLHISYN